MDQANVPSGYKLVPMNARVSVPTGSKVKGRPQKVKIADMTEEEALQFYTIKQIYNARYRQKLKTQNKK